MIVDIAMSGFIVVVATILMSMVVGRYTPEEARILRFSFVMHVVFVLANMAVVKYLYGRGDMYSFYADGVVIGDWLRSDWTLVDDVFWWMLSYESDLNFSAGSEGTRIMVALATFSNLVFFGSFAAMCYFPAMLGYFAKVALFDAFRDSFGKGFTTQVALAFTCVPSVVFWTSGMIKECIAIICMGLVAAGWRSAYARNPGGLALFFAGVYLLQVIKGHFMLTGVVGVGAMIYWGRSVKDGKITARPITFVISAVLTVIGIGAIGEIAPRFAITNLADEMIFLQERAAGGSAIDIGFRDEMGTAEFVALSPLALITGLYRPFLFEATNPPMLLNALETSLFLWLTVRGVYRRGLRGLPKLAIAHPALVFLLVFSLLSALGVGLATGNLGTMSRYRAPVIPFFVLALLAMDSMSLAPAPRRGRTQPGGVSSRRPRPASTHPAGHRSTGAGRPASGLS